jgi:hypothetical protein
MTTILSASITSAGTFYSQPFMSNDRSQRFWPQHNNIELVFTYGSGGTSVDVYLQTTHDGAVWKDIGHFAQLGTSTTRDIWRASSADSVLDPDQQVPAPHLSWWRIRYVVAGNYVATTLQINVIGASLVQASWAP